LISKGFDPQNIPTMVKFHRKYAFPDLNMEPIYTKINIDYAQRSSSANLFFMGLCGKICIHIQIKQEYSTTAYCYS
jgi:hypothetical protein